MLSLNIFDLVKVKVNEVDVGEIKRLVILSVVRCVCVCVYMMTPYRLHVSYTTGRNGGALLWKLLHFTVVMFKSLHLVEICALTSAFLFQYVQYVIISCSEIVLQSMVLVLSPSMLCLGLGVEMKVLVFILILAEKFWEF